MGRQGNVKGKERSIQPQQSSLPHRRLGPSIVALFPAASLNDSPSIQYLYIIPGLGAS